MKFMTIHTTLNSRGDADRIYLPKEGGREPASNEDFVESTNLMLKEFTKRAKKYGYQ